MTLPEPTASATGRNDHSISQENTEGSRIADAVARRSLHGPQQTTFAMVEDAASVTKLEEFGSHTVFMTPQ